MKLIFLNYCIIIILQRLLHAKRNKVNLLFRYILFYIPFLFPYLYSGVKGISHNYRLSELDKILPLILCIGMVSYNIMSNQIIFQKNFISIFPKTGKTTLIIKLYESVGSSVLEELFYRYFFLSILIDELKGNVSICLVSIFFVISHLLNINYMKKFNLKKLLILLLFSFGITYLYFSYKNIYLNIFVHLLFNLPYIIFYIQTTDWKK